LAAEKAAKLTPLEVALIDMDMTAAFGQPDGNLRLLDVVVQVVKGRAYTVYVIELTVVIVAIAVAETGRVGITDFYVTNLGLEAPPLAVM
jgi:hypothetical protein